MKTTIQKVYNPARAMAQFDRLNSLVNLVVGAVNSVATNAMMDAVFILRKTPYYKHETKKRIKLAVADYERWERVHTQNFGDRYNLFLDYLSLTEEQIQKHVDILYYSIKAALDKARVPESDIKAKVELARTLLEYACYIYDSMIDTCRKQTGLNFDHLMRPARLTAALHQWTLVRDLSCQTDCVVDLNEDPVK